jgi:NAD(P)-dependent dehydrogenase (short-subunit alcohol dehydrogenase family)
VAHRPDRKLVALVTGASSGLGRNIALALLREGYIVYGAARRVQLMKDIAAAGGHTLGMDVADQTSVKAAFERLIAAQGHIDILVNAAGYGQYGAIEDVPLEDAHRQLEVNLFGYARLIQAALPHMRAQKFGKIFNITSVGGKIYTPMGGWYHAAKFAVEGYSDVLRLEVKPFGVDVVVIEPGLIESEWGSIAIREAERISGKGAYRNLLEKYVKVQKNSKGSPPDVISDLILKVLRSRRPKARYHAGSMAGPILFLRRHLSDRMFDWLVMTSFR